MEFMVGDDKGWTVNFDYQAWAKGKEFHVGDKLGKLALQIPSLFSIFLTHHSFPFCLIAD
jgi:hypothetical protein